MITFEIMAKKFYCPYCGSENSLVLDPGALSRYEMVTDCEVCCNPLVVRVSIVAGDYEIEVRPENE